jgi:hypothetical protein
MSIAPLPTPLQHLGGRRFAFYPPIRNLEPNEWLYRRATWSECLVANARSGEEVWIPRIFLGDVSRMDEPVMIVGLNRELEWRAGAIIPRQRMVIEFPAAAYNRKTVNDDGAARPSGHKAPVINIRLESKSEVRAWKWIGVAAVLGAVAFTIVADVTRQAQSHQRADLFRTYRSYLELNATDDYSAVVGKLGAPAGSVSRNNGFRVFRSLEYPSRRYSVVLMGITEQDARYIGALDPRGRILDAVRLRDGSSSESLLHSGLSLSRLRSVPSF